MHEGKMVKLHTAWQSLRSYVVQWKQLDLEPQDTDTDNARATKYWHI